MRHTLGLAKSMRCDTQFMRADSARFGVAMEIKMITAAEYRAWAEESLECARNADSESSRQAYIKFAETWLESAFRAERLAALLERSSKEPTTTTDYEWVLPPFGEWRHKGTSLK